MTRNACICRDHRLLERAFEIADGAMMELLQSHAVRCDEFGRLWGLVDANGVEVATLAEADPAVIEAVGWLQERELCEVIKDPHGEAVVLLEVDEPMVS